MYEQMLLQIVLDESHDHEESSDGHQAFLFFAGGPFAFLLLILDWSAVKVQRLLHSSVAFRIAVSKQSPLVRFIIWMALFRVSISALTTASRQTRLLVPGTVWAAAIRNLSAYVRAMERGSQLGFPAALHAKM